MEAQDRSDEDVAVAVQQGDTEAFGILMERYQQRLIRYGTRFLSDRDDVTDVVQDIFIRTYRNIKSFDRSQRFSPWIYRIAHNAYVNELRKKQHRPLLAFDFDTLVAHLASPETPESESVQKDMRRLIDHGLKTLTPQYREVLVLYYLEELSYKEIADVLQIPVGTVSVRLKRAKEALKRTYESLNIPYEP